MHAIQALLMGAFSSLVLLTVLIFLGQALAEEVTIYDRDWRVKERIKDGTIYNKDWRIKGHIEGGKVKIGTKGRKPKLRTAEFHDSGGTRNYRRPLFCLSLSDLNTTRSISRVAKQRQK